MAKRFTDTKIWSEDWFLEMPMEYKLFWYYILSSCDHSGIFRVNTKIFSSINDVKIDSKKAIEYFNYGKDRIRVLADNLWFIEDFFAYQYGGTFNANNRVHDSIEKIYTKHGIKLTSIRGLIDLKDGVKDKDKDNKDKNNYSITYSKNSNGLKGGSGGKKFPTVDGQAPKAVKVDKKFAYFDDGTKQLLGEVQKKNLKDGVFKPNDIAKTLIY